MENQQIKWIDNNKQIGTVFSYKKDNDTVWSSVALQKWQGKIKVYIDEILESQMVAENYMKEDISSFSTLESALNHIHNHSRADIKQLKPCKGQKIFNPEFE